MEETKWYGESGKLELEELNHHFSTLDLQAWPWFSYPAMAFSGFDHKRKINRKSCTQDHNFNHMAQQQSDLFFADQIKLSIMLVILQVSVNWWIVWALCWIPWEVGGEPSNASWLHSTC